VTRNRATLTVTESIDVHRSPDEVFDFTQDYYHRADWDPGIVSAEILGEDPRRVRVEARVVGRYTVEYRLFRRGERTSAAFTDVDSAWMSGGGGSWRYEPIPSGTRWTQTNTIELRAGLMGRLMAPIFRRGLRSSMREGMARARDIMEAAGESSRAAARPTEA
jgi:uncharacterized membrane protein